MAIAEGLSTDRELPHVRVLQSFMKFLPLIGPLSQSLPYFIGCGWMTYRNKVRGA